MADFKVYPTFNRDMHHDLFEDANMTFDRSHFVLFRKNYNARTFKFDLVEKMALEMPNGAFIAGEAIRSVIQRQEISNVDFFFTGEESFIKMAKRIQNAAEGSVFHGYKAVEPLSSMVEFGKHLVTYVKSGSPNVNLVRIRWFDTSEQLIDKMNFQMDMVAIDSNLDVTFFDRALADISGSNVSINRCLFQVDAAFKWKKFRNEGYRWRSQSGYDGWFADELLKIADRHETKMKKAGKQEDTRFVVS